MAQGSQYDFRDKPHAGVVKRSTTDKATESAEQHAKEQSGELLSLSIDCAENGYTVRCRHEQPKPKGNQPMPYIEPLEYVFETPEKTLEFVGKKLRGQKV